MNKKHPNRELVVVGLRFGRFTILEDLGSFQDGKLKRTMVSVKCDCGSIVERFLSVLKSGGSKSCGCLKREMAKKWGYERSYIHGKSEHTLMGVWSGIIQRCTNPKNKYYRNYGGLGVCVCPEWANSYESFYDWCLANGWQQGLQIDKDIIPKKLGIPALLYSPKMCCIVTREQNNRAKRTNVNLTFNGVTKCSTDWAKELGISQSAMNSRIKRWPLDKALSTHKLK